METKSRARRCSTALNSDLSPSLRVPALRGAHSVALSQLGRGRPPTWRARQTALSEHCFVQSSQKTCRRVGLLSISQRCKLRRREINGHPAGGGKAGLRACLPPKPLDAHAAPHAGARPPHFALLRGWKHGGLGGSGWEAIALPGQQSRPFRVPKEGRRSWGSRHGQTAPCRRTFIIFSPGPGSFQNGSRAIFSGPSHMTLPRGPWTVTQRQGGKLTQGVQPPSWAFSGYPYNISCVCVVPQNFYLSF